MEITTLNKNFLCNNPLYASDLNDIVAALNSIINHVNSNLSGWDNSRVDVPTISYDPSTGVLTIDGTPYQIENPNDLNLGVAVYEGCPGTIQNPQIGAIYKCTSTGHIYIYTGKNSDSVTIDGTTRIGWFDLGEFSGSGSSYLHIAYALSITFNNANPPIITGYEGFTTSVNTGTFYKWYGIYTDDNEEDPTISNNNSNALNLEIVRKYKWNYLKGPDTNNKEYIYMLGTDRTKVPSIEQNKGYYKNSSGNLVYSTDNNVKLNDEFLPEVNLNGNSANDFYQDSSEHLHWYDDPPVSVSSTLQVLWWTSRSRKSDGTWDNFRTPTILDEYTLVSPGLTPSGSQGGPRWAFGRFSDSTAASSAVDTINANITEGSTFTIPSGWSESDNLASGSGDLYMIYAYVNGSGEIIKNQRTVNSQTQDFYWYGPFRIGSNNSTSGIGADDDNYNYIYCRTTSDVVSTSNGNTQLTNDDWSRIIYNIEALENNFVSNNEHVYNSSNTINNYNNLWTDHPQGVSSIYPYEWKMAFTKVLGETVNIGGDTTTQKYKLEWGPFLDSHFGHDGKDGDGFEYIFKVGNFETNTTISYINAKFRNPDYPLSGSEFITGVNANANDLLNDTNYLHDDFIPNGWTDENGTIDLNNPVEYMSKRKREDSNGERKWGPFSSPVIWRTFASSGLLATIDNDSIFIDDNAGKDTVEYASQTIPALWDGANNLTEVNNYTVTISYRGDPDLKSLLIPGKATINNDDVEVDQNSNNRGWDKNFSASANSRQLFALTTTSQNPNFVNGLTGQIIYTVSANGITASIVLPISVVDFGTDAQAFTLMITPNCATVKRTNSSSNYTFYDGTKNCTLTVEVAKSTGSGVSPVTVQGILPSSNPTDEKLYIKVKNSSGSYLSTTSSANNPYYSYSSSHITLNNITPLSTDYNYLEVELYYIYSGNAIKVDNEIINFVPKGDDGTISGDLSSIETYIISSDNDNAVIDDTVPENIKNDNTKLNSYNTLLTTATKLKLTVEKANVSVNSNITFEVTQINLPVGLKLQTSSNENFATSVDVNTSIGYSSPYFRIIADTNTIGNSLVKGNYKPAYTVLVKHNEDVIGSKVFNLTVLDISLDSSTYKLIINNDTVSYDSNNDFVGGSPTIYVKKVGLSGSEAQNFCFGLKQDLNDSSSSLYHNYNLTNNSIFVIINHNSYNGDGYYDTLIYNNNLWSSSSSLTPAGRCVINYDPESTLPYSSTGYDIELHVNKLIVDVEHIDCRKDGSSGAPGYSLVIVRLYKRSSQPITSTGITGLSIYNFTNKRLEFTNGGNNNWLTSIPTGSGKLYMTAATAYGSETSDPINSNEWVNPVEVEEDGTTPKYNIRTIFLYKRSNTTPTVKPTNELYYYFSTNLLKTTQSTTDSEPSSYTVEEWKRIPPDGTDALYEIHATALSKDDMDVIESSDWSDIGVLVPAIPDINLLIASAGKLYYYAGEYKTGDSLPDDTFIATKYQVPYIKYNEKFYVLYVLDSELVAGQYEATAFPGGNENHWVEMEGGINKFYMAEAYFGEFAKFGSAIISGDYLISTNGKINGTPYNDGSLYPGTNKPAYTKFVLAPTTGSIINSCGAVSSKYYRLYVPEGITVKVSFLKLSYSNNALLTCRITNGSTNLRTHGTTSMDTLKTLEEVTIPESGYYIELLSNRPGNTDFLLYYEFTNVFEPNYWVNLLTGETGAASGNFLISNDGINIGKGNLLVDNDGNLTAKGNITSNKFSTDGKSGNRIEISGGLFNVYNTSGQIGLSIGWDDDGNPFIFLTNGKSGNESLSYKLTYQGVLDASANITSDDATSIRRLIEASSISSATTLHTGPSVTEYYLYFASKSNITGAYASTNPSNSSSSDTSWLNARKYCDGKLFTTSTISNILGLSSSYLISDGYYVSCNENEEISDGFSRELYYYYDGRESKVGTVRYKASGSTWDYCDSDWQSLGVINGLNHSKQFHASDHLDGKDRSI